MIFAAKLQKISHSTKAFLIFLLLSQKKPPGTREAPWNHLEPPKTRASAIGTREAHMELLEPPGTPEEPLELLEGLMEQSRRLS